jgi:hypothetical protein
MARSSAEGYECPGNHPPFLSILDPRYRRGLEKAWAKTNTAKRFSCVLGMLSSLGVQVPRPT